MQQREVDAAQAYMQSRMRNFAPPERLLPWQWAEKHVVISERFSPHPGPYRADVSPHCIEPMEVWADPSIRIMVVVFPAQSGKTQNLVAVLTAWDIAQDPAPSLIIMPSENNARSYSETRLQPVIDDCLETARCKPDDSDKYKLLEMHFDRMTLNLVGAQSAGNVASRPIRKLKADESDKYGVATDREADVLSLALERVKAYWNSSVLITSTVTFAEANSWKWWGRSDKRHYELRCPHCKKYQKLIFGMDQEYRDFEGVVPRPKGDHHESLYRLKWPKNCSISDLDHAAWYECIFCHDRIYDHHKDEMLKEWRYKAYGPSGTISGHHTNALSIPWITFGQTAAQFLRSKNDPEELQNFFNSWLCIPWDAAEQGTDLIDLSGLADRQANQGNRYKKNQVPEGVIFLTIAIDVQEHEVWYTVKGHGRDEQQWGIDWGKVEVEAEDIRELKRVVAELMDFDYGKPIILGGIDSGYGRRTPEVYAVTRIQKRLVCIKGRRNNISKATDGKDDPLPKPKRLDKYPNGKPIKGGVIHYTPSTSYWKRYFFGRVGSKDSPMYWPDDIDKRYKRHLQSERETVKKNKAGRTERYFVVRKGYKDNHMLDCDVMNCVLRHIVLTATTIDKVEAAVTSGKFDKDYRPPPQKQRGSTKQNF